MMSNRTLVELNHDLCPDFHDDRELLAWAESMAEYMRSGNKDCLPIGVTFKHIRHPLGAGPDGWSREPVVKRPYRHVMIPPMFMQLVAAGRLASPAPIALHWASLPARAVFT